jgi:MerR family transcriptional regulator, heat shock protein HspR
VKAKPSYRMISWVAETYNVHPQTLRLWEREGLLQPNRSQGNTRLYDEESCRRLETILTLTRDLGVNLAGVEIIINLRDQLAELKRENERLTNALRQLMHEQNDVPRYHALVKVETGSLQIVEDE